jgi:hypothetical protein
VTLKLDWYAYEAPAVVRGNRLFRHRALLDMERNTAVVMIAQGPPRAWQRTLEAGVGGICEALESGETDAEPLLAAAAARIRAADAALVDDNVIQAHATAVTVKGDKASVASAGSCRAYLARGDEHRRISGTSDAKGLRNAFSFASSTESLAPGDVVVVGPSHLFNVAGVAWLARVLHDQQAASTRHIARGLLSASGSSGTGGSVIVLRTG